MSAPRGASLRDQEGRSSESYGLTRSGNGSISGDRMATSTSWQAVVHKARRRVKHRPTDVVPQPLVVDDELADRFRKLVTLPLALQSPCEITLAFGRGGTCGLDRIGGRAELMRGDMCDDPGLASSVCGMPCCPAQVSGRAHRMPPRRASPPHRDLATHPGASMLDRLARPWVPRPNQLEQVKDVLRARCRPQSEQMVIWISEGPTAADRHEARVPDLREDHGRHSFSSAVDRPSHTIAASGARSGICRIAAACGVERARVARHRPS
jgi:hypothetical protein